MLKIIELVYLFFQCIAVLATLCQAGFFNENNADSEDKTMVQEDQDICQRQVDQLAKALKTCYETPSSPPISGFLKRDLARGKPKKYHFCESNLGMYAVNFDIL